VALTSAVQVACQVEPRAFGEVSSRPLQPRKFMTTARQPRWCAAAHIHLQ